MFFWRHDTPPQGPIYDWLLAHKAQIRDGTAEYMGTPVNDATEFVQFRYVISLCAATLTFTSPHDLPTPANAFLNGARWKYALVTFLLGWWCFPWGPPFTIHALIVNLGGGRKRTAGSLLQFIETGWDAPYDAAASIHRKDLVDVSDRAAAEIRLRIAKRGFPERVGVRITPGKWADGKVAVTFDYPVSDGRDWIDESQELLLLIDKNDEAQLAGCRLDFRDGAFWATPAAEP